ncbi:MAG: EAL domain-containing protein [Motiliproteus sp.]|nr:EAL domain-containing protein [Motiliproteus sp.]MCW9052039.1 EAL domain-containing protein [Motiliproteus sp.]
MGFFTNKGLTIRSKLLTLVVINALAFVVITGLVLFSLRQASDLATDVATRQMAQVIENSKSTRELSTLFTEVHKLNLSVNGSNDALFQIHQRLSTKVSEISIDSELPELKQRLIEFSKILDELVIRYQAVNSNLSAIKQTDTKLGDVIAEFEADISNQLIESTLKGEDTHFSEQILSLVSGFRENLLEVGKLHAELQSSLTMEGNTASSQFPMSVIDDLLLRLQTLTASTPEVAAYGQQLLELTGHYRSLQINLSEAVGELHHSRIEMAQQELQLLQIIANTDLQTTETTQVLAAKLDSIVGSSGITVLVLAIAVIVLLTIAILVIIRTSINHPIENIIHGIEDFRRGKLLKRINLKEQNEWGTIGSALNKMANDLYMTYSELKESEDKFYQVFENELNGLLIFEHSNGTCLDANRTALESYGYSLGEIKTIRLNDIEQPVKQEEKHRGSADGWISCFHRRKDGSLFPVEVHTGTFQRQGTKYLFKSVRDMTQQRYLQRQQQRTLSLLEATLESTSEGVLALSQKGSVINYNQKFVDLFHVPEKQLMSGTGKRVLPYILEQLQERSEFMDMIRDSYQLSEKTSSKVLELNDGRMFECHTQPQILNGEAVGRVWNFRDVSEYFKVMDELRDKEHRLAHLAHHDPLTGLANRLLFMDRLEHAIYKAQRSKEQLALFFIDLDRFKSINDSLGHMVGDILLKSFCDRLSGAVRQVDTIARLGGDEFTLILDSVQSSQDAALVARKILDTLKEPFQANEHRFYVTASIGISFYPDDGKDAETLLRNADAAMYRSKDEGRNTFHFYTEDMTTQAFERVVMESNLRTALEQDQFVVYYQPQYDLFSGQMIGAEALVRWEHPELGFIGPDRFLPTAEETGLIIDIDNWVFKHVCQQVAQWHEELIDMEGMRFAVNLSGGQLKHESLPSHVAEIVQQTGCDPNYLELEITEGFIMHNPELSTRLLGELRDQGIHLSIDDFGTGYSSLSYLKRLPINKLKIDKSFVMDIANDPNDEAIAKSVIALGHSMNLQVVAEGIEDKEQEAFLKAEGCDMGQGYLYSRPLKVQAFEQMLRSGANLSRAM